MRGGTGRSPRRRAATAWGLAREGAWGDLARTAARRILPWQLLYVDDLHFVRLRRPREIPVPADRTRVRQATVADIDRLDALRPRGDGPRAKLALGDWCFLAEAGERAVAVAWFERGGVHLSRESSLEFRYPPDGCWSYWVEVHPEYRLRGAFLTLWLGTMAQLRELGVRSVYSAIEEANQASLRAHLRLGFEELLRLQAVRLLGVVLHRTRRPGGAWRWGLGRFVAVDPPA